MEYPYWEEEVAYTILKSLLFPSPPSKINLRTRQYISHMNFSIADYCERKESETAFLLFVYKYL
jgi:hypothetical protein